MPRQLPGRLLALAIVVGGCGGTSRPVPSESEPAPGMEPADEGEMESEGATEPSAAAPAPEEDDGAEVVETRTGRASYHSDRLAGRSTASGAPYDPGALTAASRDIAFGTRLRVTRVDTGASVTVTVNDRGPFGDRRRIVDLSRRAAEKLDMIRAGVVDVRVDVLGTPGEH